MYMYIVVRDYNKLFIFLGVKNGLEYESILDSQAIIMNCFFLFIFI